MRVFITWVFLGSFIKTFEKWTQQDLVIIQMVFKMKWALGKDVFVFAEAH